MTEKLNKQGVMRSFGKLCVFYMLALMVFLLRHVENLVSDSVFQDIKVVLITLILVAFLFVCADIYNVIKAIISLKKQELLEKRG